VPLGLLRIEAETRNRELRKNGGLTTWCLAAGGTKHVRGYFEWAGVDMSLENVISCDTHVHTRTGKAYNPAFDRFGPDDDK